MAALRVLARSNAPNRAVLVEQYIDEYLKTESVGLTRSLERFRRVELRTVSRQQAQRRTGMAFSSLPGLVVRWNSYSIGLRSSRHA
jgi:hypothetical protein